MFRSNSKQAHQRQRMATDRQWQRCVYRNLAPVALLVGVGQALMIQLLTSESALMRWSGGPPWMLILVAQAAFTALLCLALWFLSLRITHSVVGPARVIQTALEQLARGSFDSRLELRKRDYLHALADSARALTRQLETDVRQRVQLRAELEQALNLGQIDRTRELADRLAGIRLDPGTGSPACDRSAA